MTLRSRSPRNSNRNALARRMTRHSRIERLESRRMLAVFPNDPGFSQQWPLHNTGQFGGIPDADIDAPEAWEVSTGSMKTVVALLDTGVDYTDPDLYLNIWLNQGEIPSAIASALVDSDGDGLFTFRDLNDAANSSHASDVNGNGYIDGGDLLDDPRWENGFDEDGNGRVDDLIGWDAQDGDNDPQYEENFTHGTNLARVIGAIGDNGLGSTGVNWQIRIMPVRVRLDGEIEDAKVVTGIEYAAESEASILSAAFRGNPRATADEFSAEIYSAIDYSRTNGKLFLTAAGNGSRDTDLYPWYPQSYDVDNNLTVAALSHTGDQLSLSDVTNWGEASVDFAVSTDNGTTSYALGYATGIAGLIKSVHPEWTYSQIKSQMLLAVDSLPSLQGLTKTGGTLNAAKAVGVIFADSFETGGGAGDWTGNWVDGGQADWFRSTQRATDGAYSAEVDGFANDATLTLATPIDLSSYDVATLTFDWLIESGFDSGEYLALDVYDGTSWRSNVLRLDGDVAAENIWHNETVDLTAYSSSSLLIRFRSLVSSSNEDANVDNVRIVGTQWGIPEVSISDASSVEGDGTFFTVTLSNPSNQTVTVDFTTADGTANDGSDYSGVSGTLVFEPGVTSRTIVIPTIDDSDIEPTENFFVNLFNATGATVADGQAEGSTLENDQPNQSPTAVLDEVTAQSGIAALIDVLANDSDPENDPLSVVTVDSPTSQGGTVVINPDDTLSYTSAPGFTGIDTFTYTISDGQGGTATATVTIDVSEAPANAIIVANISFQSRKGGKEWRAIFDVQDQNGLAVSGANITVTFAGQTYSDVTDGNGQYQTEWRSLSSGSYEAEVTDLALSGYTWDLTQGWPDSEDEDLFPDRILTF